MPEGTFDKDFGYLMPFLDKVTSAASAISDPASREECRQLVDGEKERWTRIRQLLSGSAKSSSESVEKPALSKPNADPPVTQKAEETISEQFQFTVGSLRSR